MSKLGRFWDSVLPGLIALEPMGALAYYQAVAAIEPSQTESPRTRRLELISSARGGVLIVRGDVQRAAPLRP